MTTEAKFKRSGSATLKAFVDSEPLKFGVDGFATAEVETGEHSLTWVVVGAPGSNYTISIIEPESCEFSHSAKLDASKKDGGLKWFTA